MISKYSLSQLADAFNLADCNLSSVRSDVRESLIVHMRSIRAEVLHRSMNATSPRIRNRAVRMKDAMAERIRAAVFQGMTASEPLA
jgi:ubiquinone biosynthesis protein UbiJ